MDLLLNTLSWSEKIQQSHKPKNRNRYWVMRIHPSEIKKNEIDYKTLWVLFTYN